MLIALVLSESLPCAGTLRVSWGCSVSFHFHRIALWVKQLLSYYNDEKPKT